MIVDNIYVVPHIPPSLERTVLRRRCHRSLQLLNDSTICC
jgi:hypothetical protein